MSCYRDLEGDMWEGEIIKTISIDQEHLYKDRDCAIVFQTVFLIQIWHLRHREWERKLS